MALACRKTLANGGGRKTVNSERKRSLDRWGEPADVRAATWTL